MPRYRAYGKVVGTKYLGEFDAPNEAAAKTMALSSDAASPALCHQCSDECEDPEIDEDGVIIEAVEAVETSKE